MNQMMTYELIDHPADFGIRVFGSSVEDLFRNAALGLFDQLTDIQLLVGNIEKTIVIDGDDYPDLMVNWMRELLYLWNAQEYLLKDVTKISINDFRLEAIILIEPYDQNRHPIKTEIKAVTYYKIEAHQTASGWEAVIIFDV